MQVRVILARCAQTKKSFGIRFEERRIDHWVATWAFSIKKSSAEREGYDRSEIRGAFDFAVSYPGCPHCGATSIFKCSCGRIACWDGKRQIVTCPWCGKTGELRGVIESMDARVDR